jgi:ribosome-associated translation inhibitor RaiA
MQVHTNTDRHITGSERLSAHVETLVTDALGRFTKQITRVEVHLRDENGAKGGANDIRCLMEARLEGRSPTVVTHQAASVYEATEGAAAKLARAIESTLGRLRQF